jgi:Lipocalin-like domain
MNSRIILSLSAIAAVGLAMLPGNAVAQTKSLKDQLVGTWVFVSSTNTKPDGSKFDPWGANPKGTTIYEANGHYAFMLMRSDLPKFTDRSKTTPEEGKAVVQGSIAYYGTYTVDEPSKTVTLHVEGSTVAALNGTDQKRIIKSISADEMNTLNPVTSDGGTPADTIYKRAK